jgi:histidyl-tRNA synthetase
MPKVFLPKGTRDLLPATMNRRLAVIDTVRGVFSRYGFDPLETPAFERIETLTGKYGDEGEKLMFRILKRGEGGGRGEVDQALRYDLTVPLARVIAMNPGLPLPFKRSQIQPVWRADRPQKGRYREFYLDKIGRDGVSKELAGRGFSSAQIEGLWPLLDGEPIPGAEAAEAQIQTIVDLATDLGVAPDRVVFDRTLARGLDYYTGPVFEAVLDGEYSGSIAGGGRYDGLIGMFSGRDVPAVGISLGIERIFMLMEEMGQLPALETTTKVWVTVFDEDSRAASLQAATALRAAGINTGVSDKLGKLGKQLKEADKRGVGFALVCGPSEIAAGTVVLKDLTSGEQFTGTVEEVVQRLGEPG